MRLPPAPERMPPPANSQVSSRPTTLPLSRFAGAGAFLIPARAGNRLAEDDDFRIRAGRPAPAAAGRLSSMASIYDFSAKALDGKEKSLADFRGQVLLVVNTASKCGFTPQYEGLEALYRKYHAKGFEVLGFPCNQFGAQEPGDAARSRRFCSLNYDVTFPMFAKIDVNGAAGPSALRISQEREEGRSRDRGDQMEFHQIPGRSAGQCRRALRPDASQARRDLDPEVARLALRRGGARQ